MESHKKHDRMGGDVNTPVPELAELTRAANVTEAVFGSNMLPDEPQSLACMSAVRHFGAAIHGLTPGALLADPLVTKHFYDRGGGGGGGEFGKCDGAAWEDFAAAESLPGGTLSLSAPGACKFIKDEKEPATNFEPPPDVTALDGDRKQQQQQQPQTGGPGDGEPAVSFTPRPAGLDTSANFVLELDQPDSRCGFSGRSAANFDTGRNPAQQLAVFKNEAPRWQTPPADSQFWCQVPAAVTEDPFVQSGYEGGQGQPMAQRILTTSFTFPG